MSVEYRELLATVSKTIAEDTTEARKAAVGTLAVLARVLDEDARTRLRDALPGELRSDVEATGPPDPWDDVAVVQAVSIVTDRPVEQARLSAQAVLTAVAEQDPDLMAELRIPERVQPLLATPAPGAGVS